MHRYKIEKRKEERAKIKETATKLLPFKIIEEDTGTITKLLAGKPYDKEDIRKIAKILLPKYGHNFEHQFVIFDKIEHFDDAFENVTVRPEKPIFVVFGKKKIQWILFSIIQTKTGRILVLFKDPCGALVSLKLEIALEKKFPGVEFIAHSKSEQKDTDDKSYGPLTVRNLKILLDFLKKKLPFGDFSKIEFAPLTDLSNEKFSKIVSLTNELSDKEEFKKALKEFIDKIPIGPATLASDVSEYRKIMKEELGKGEEHMDIERIQKARAEYLTEEKIQKFQNNCKINPTRDRKDYVLEIQRKFPDEIDKVKDIFQVLGNIKDEKQLCACLEHVSNILKIDYNKLKSFYESNPKEQTKKEEKLTPEDINEIAKKLPQMKNPPGEDNTPLDQLLKEITLGMDQDEPSPNQEDIKKLEEKYHSVKQKYTRWANSTIEEINTWARKIKGNLGTTDDDVCETIAIMDRAFNLLTGGFRLRDTQILAVLIFFHGDRTQGRLCQIKTGEGKTIIVSLVATIRALQGDVVDVITSNILLAADGVEQTRTFYSTFGLTVSTNNPESKIGYLADVLYGTISNFQFDFLKDSFEGYNIRRGRKFGSVVLDEVDSMLVDNGGHIAKLAAPFPGMESLRYIYIKIWQALYKAEEKFAQDCKNKVKEILEKHPDRKVATLHCQKFIEEMVHKERDILKEMILASNPTDVPLVPKHLKEYVDSKVNVWIKNALYAKYNCHEHQQYRILTNDTGEKIVAPVDYLNTGVTMKNTIWSNGLHHFVQLKHNLYLTFESLTSSFISNIGYIKNYQDRNILGLTGTLGSRAEQELLSQIYNVNYAKLPTYKTKKFAELPGLIVEHDSWATRVTLEVLGKIDEERAVLVICETEKDLLSVKTNLKIFESEIRIREYANEDNAKETERKVKIGDVILATNIAGRGTNFKTEKSLEGKGGLHVCVGFLPCNLRVEGQAFGRTSRQGNSGTAQLIIRRSEVEELDLSDESPSFVKIKQERDRLERERLKEINDVLVKELNFKDELFKYFSKYHRELKKERMTESYRYNLQDLKEFWAFWLEKKDFKAGNIEKTTPEGEFRSFLKDADTIIEGTINHNPFYCVALGDYYLEKGDKVKAGSILERAIQMCGEDNLDLLAGAHFKLFELAIADGNQIMERFRKAVAKIFFINVKENAHYRNQAKTHLNRAKSALLKEINYIEEHLNVEKNPDFQNILNENDNLFMKHLNSRWVCLQTHLANIDNLLESIDTIPGGVDIGGKATTSLDTFAQMSGDPKIKSQLTSSEMIELQSIGVDSIYALREVYDVSDTVIHAAQGQILGGLAALAAGICFPPIFPAMSSIAGTLISEGIMDIVMEILNKGNKFNNKMYMASKLISYSISLISLGVSALTQSIAFLNKAVSACRRLSHFLRKSTYLKSLCNRLANLIDRMGDMLEGMLAVAKFNKLSKVDQLDELLKLKNSGNLKIFEKVGGIKKLEKLQTLKDLNKLRELKRSKLLVDGLKSAAIKTGTKGKSIAKEVFMKQALNTMFQDIIDVFHHFKKCLIDSIKNNQNVIEKLKTTSKAEIDEVVEEFSKDDENRKIAEVAVGKFLALFNNKVIEGLSLIYDLKKNSFELDRYINKFSSFLEENLPGGEWDHDVDPIIEEICTKQTEIVFSVFLKVCQGSLKGIIFVGKQVWNKCTNKSKDTESVHSPDKMDKENSEDNEDDSASSDSTVIKNDPYSVLGLQADASVAEVKTQFRRLALVVHPNKNTDDPDANDKFKILNEAYHKILKTNPVD